MEYWDLVKLKHEKREVGLCYCKEEKEINSLAFYPYPESKCIFCMSKGSTYDPDYSIQKTNEVTLGRSRYD